MGLFAAVSVGGSVCFGCWACLMGLFAAVRCWRLGLFWMLGVLDGVNCGGKVLGFAIIGLLVKWDAAFCKDVACLIPP